MEKYRKSSSQQEDTEPLKTSEVLSFSFMATLNCTHSGSSRTDFLTGTTSKIKRYKEPLLYKKLFQYFQTNLKEAEKLIIIGYGAKDKEINRMLVEHFDHQKKPSFIVDPHAGDSVKDLQKNLGATLITTSLEDLSIEEFS